MTNKKKGWFIERYDKITIRWWDSRGKLPDEETEEQLMEHAWERVKSQVDKGFTSGQLSCDSTENSRERNFTGYWSYDKNLGEHLGKSVHICLFPKSIFTEEDLLEVFGTKEFCCFDDERQVRGQFPELKQAVIIVEKLPWFIENNNKGTFQNNFLMKEIYI